MTTPLLLLLLLTTTSTLALRCMNERNRVETCDDSVRYKVCHFIPEYNVHLQRIEANPSGCGTNDNLERQFAKMLHTSNMFIANHYSKDYLCLLETYRFTGLDSRHIIRCACAHDLCNGQMFNISMYF